jgi:glycosyltransferase involved in cell wall biosynthesis
MKFHFLIYSAFPHYSGGRETWLSHVAVRLRARGHTVRIYSYRNHSAPLFHDLGRSDGLRVTEVPVPLSIPTLGPKIVRSYLHVVNMAMWTVAVFLLIAVRKRSRDEVFIALGTVADSAPLLLARALLPRAFFICAVRGPHAANESIPLPLMKRFFFFMERMSTERADLVVANGVDTQRRLSVHGVESIVVPNGVDLKNYRLDPTLEPLPAGFPAHDAKIVVMTASLMVYRQIDTSLEALAICRQTEDAPAVRMVFVGKGDQTPWRTLAERLGVTEWVTFLGERRDIARILAHSDVALALCDGAHAGGLSMSLLEAMAAAKAVVVSENETYRQLVTDGREGRVVAESNPEALAKTILGLAADDGNRAALGMRAYERVREFDWEAVTDCVEKVARDVPRSERGKT